MNMRIIIFDHARIVGNLKGRHPVRCNSLCGDQSAEIAAAASKPLFTQSPMPIPR